MFILVNGLLAGLGLAAMLALGDGLFGTQTFPVLIDVSYVPGMENLPSIVELLIHLLISIVLAFFLMHFYPRGQASAVAKYLGYWNLGFALAYVVFSWLSGTMMSWIGFLIWVLGHLLYSVMLMVQMERQVKQ